MRAVAIAGAIVGVSTPAQTPSALAWFAPWVEVDGGDVVDMAEGKVVAEILPADGDELAVFLAGRLEADAGAFVRAVRQSEALWRSQKIPEVVRLSIPPRLEDLSSMRLGERDLEAIGRCRPGDCGIKLTAREIARLQLQGGSSGGSPDALQEEFRRIVLARIAAYLDEGLRGIDPFHDHDEPVEPQHVGSQLLLRSPWFSERAVILGDYLERFPNAAASGFETFLYWMRTTYTPRPTIQVVHVILQRREEANPGEPDVLVASRQVFATHYVNGSLAVTAFLRDPDVPERRYLAYVNRSHVDGISGWFSPVTRYLVERRVRGAAREIFALQRSRIETLASAESDRDAEP